MRTGNFPDLKTELLITCKKICISMLAYQNPRSVWVPIRSKYLDQSVEPILLDQKANPCRIVKSVVSNYRCIGRIDLTFEVRLIAKHYKDKRFTS